MGFFLRFGWCGPPSGGPSYRAPKGGAAEPLAEGDMGRGPAAAGSGLGRLGRRTITAYPVSRFPCPSRLASLQRVGPCANNASRRQHQPTEGTAMHLTQALEGTTLRVVDTTGRVIAEVDVEPESDKLKIEVRRIDESYTGPVEVTVR